MTLKTIATTLLCALSSIAISKSTPQRVVVAKAIIQSVPLQLEYIGNMKANNSAAIKARVTGDVMAYHFKEGSHVSKGELLFTIDPRPYKAILDEAKAKLAQDKAELAYALNQVKRYKPLAKEEYISTDDFYNYQTQAAKLKAQVAKDGAAIHFARLNLNYCFVKAPFTGRTGPRLTDPGNLVESKGGTADPTLVTIKQLDPIKVIFAVPEKDLSLIREAHDEKALSMSLTPNGNPNHRVKGKLWLYDNTVNVDTGMIVMEGILPNPKEILWPGKFATVTLSIKTSKETVLIPTKAILLGQSGPYVYVVNKNNKTLFRILKTGRSYQDKTIVTSGLKVGEQVVTEGQESLQSNMLVKVGNP